MNGDGLLKFLPIEKLNTIADYLENVFTLYDLCDEQYEKRVEARVQALFEAEDNRSQKK
jgi:hypothetical protein